MWKTQELLELGWWEIIINKATNFNIIHNNHNGEKN